MRGERCRPLRPTCPPGSARRGPGRRPSRASSFRTPCSGRGFDGLPDQLVGFRGPTACQVVGITYRQLDYWARTGLVAPSIRGAAGSGCSGCTRSRTCSSSRSSSGCSTPGSRCRTSGSPSSTCAAAASATSRDHPVLRRHHGVRVQPRPRRSSTCCSGGQGVFGIAVCGAMKEISGSIKRLPGGARRRRHRGRHPRGRALPPPGAAGDQLADALVGAWLCVSKRQRFIDAPAPAGSRPTSPPGAGPRIDSGRRPEARRVSDGTTTVFGAWLRWGGGRRPRAGESGHVPDAEGANPPRNLSGPRTARGRRLWKATPAAVPTSADGESRLARPAGESLRRPRRRVTDRGGGRFRPACGSPAVVLTSRGPDPRGPP